MVSKQLENKFGTKRELEFIANRKDSKSNPQRDFSDLQFTKLGFHQKKVLLFFPGFGVDCKKRMNRKQKKTRKK